jgi:hypothetical protein
MLQDCFNTKNEANALKGEKVELISDNHFPVLLVSSLTTGNSFPVKAEGTDYEKQKKKK